MRPYKTALLISYICTASISAAIITPALPQIQHDLRLDHAELGWVVSSFLLAYTLGQILYGPLANKFGGIKALRTGYVINLIGIGISIIAAHALSYSMLIVGRFITALGASAGLSCTFILLNTYLDANRAKYALSYSAFAFTFGIGLAVLLGGWWTQYGHWQTCFWGLLLHGVVVLISTWLLPPLDSPGQEFSWTTLFLNYTTSFKNQRLVIFSLFVAWVTLISYSYSTIAPVIAQNNLHLSPSHYGYWNLLNMLGMCIGAILAARWTQIFSSLTLIGIASLGTGACLVLMSFLVQLQCLNAISFFGLSALIFFGSSFIFPAASHSASNAIADKSNASSAMNLINMGVAVCGVSLSGYLPGSPVVTFICINLVFLIACCTLLSIFLIKTKTYNFFSTKP